MMTYEERSRDGIQACHRHGRRTDRFRRSRRSPRFGMVSFPPGMHLRFVLRHRRRGLLLRRILAYFLTGFYNP